MPEIYQRRQQQRPNAWLRIAGLAYAMSGFLIALVGFLYTIPFLLNLKVAGTLLVSPSIDLGPRVSPGMAVLVDSCLIAAFGLQHSLMARDGFKRWFAAHAPAELTRATFVHASSLALWALLLLWQPLPFLLVDLSAGSGVLTGFNLLAWSIVLIGALNVDLLQLWGVRQAWAWCRGKTYERPTFEARWLYGWLRHPIYSGLLLVFWATPRLTVGHLLFAAGMTTYILIGRCFEERDLLRQYGDAYRHYQHSVPAFVPRLRSPRAPIC